MPHFLLTSRWQTSEGELPQTHCCCWHSLRTAYCCRRCPGCCSRRTRMCSVPAAPADSRAPQGAGMVGPTSSGMATGHPHGPPSLAWTGRCSMEFPQGWVPQCQMLGCHTHEAGRQEHRFHARIQASLCCHGGRRCSGMTQGGHNIQQVRCVAWSGCTRCSHPATSDEHMLPKHYSQSRDPPRNTAPKMCRTPPTESSRS